MTGKNGKEPRDDLETEYVPKYGLRWAKLKEWLDEHFADSGCTFTKKFDVVRCCHSFARAYSANETTREKIITLCICRGS